MFFHVALAMIFMLVAMITITDPPEPPKLEVSFANIDDRKDFSDDSTPRPTYERPNPREPQEAESDDPGKPTELLDSGEIGSAPDLAGINLDKHRPELIGVAGAGDFFGIVEGPGGNGDGDGDGDGRGEKPRGGSRPDVVYLIDRSGSMVDTFGAVRGEMLMSIAGMKPHRKFHVVLFADGRPIEKAPRAMTRATDAAKLRLVKFLQPVRASGRTDPIPAINHAFDALPTGPAARATIIYLLTDGVFPDNDRVLRTIRRRNAGRRIRINTILYGNRPPIAEEVMKEIAADSGGEYRFVSRDE
jgi:hypothetical protein